MSARVFPFLSAGVEAHATVPGMGDYGSGLLHPFLTPSHLIVLLGMGLLLGQQSPPRRLVPTVGVFAVMAATGLLMTCIYNSIGMPPPSLVVVGLCLGMLVAGAWPIKAGVCLAACAATGVALGLDSGVDPGVTGAAVAKTLCATWVGLTLGVLNVAHYSARLPDRQWARTAVRIAGSWIVAIGTLALAFSLRR